MTLPLVVGIDGSEAGLEAVDRATDEAVRHSMPRTSCMRRPVTESRPT
ncbi:hypothetical protein [Streptomyces chartreusis]